MKITKIATVGILILMCGCATPGRLDYYKNITDQAANIDLTDGVGKPEALLIAKAHLIDIDMHKECNFDNPTVKESELFDNAWLVVFNTRLAAKLKHAFFWYEINVDKASGQILNITY